MLANFHYINKTRNTTEKWAKDIQLTEREMQMDNKYMKVFKFISNQNYAN